jgi:hypothetical protein
VPPRKIEIVGMSAGSRLKIKENEIVELKCVVHEAKPKAHIVWFRENSEFVTGKFLFVNSRFLNETNFAKSLLMRCVAKLFSPFFVF